MKTHITVLIGSILLMGCSQKAPVALQNHTSQDINKGILLDTHSNNVPLDKSFAKQRYSYIINSEKKGNTFFDNDILVKSFYLLHHANLIVITGNIDIAEEYMLYLMKNGVTAPIEINDTGINSNKVMIDTIHYSPIKEKKD